MTFINNLFGNPKQDEEEELFPEQPRTETPVEPVPSYSHEPVVADPLADISRHVADKKQGLTVIDGIAQMFGGKAGSTAGTKADLDNQLGNARADDTRRKQELLQKYKDSRNKVTDAREDAKFDKGAPLANANRLLLMKKLLPEVPPEQQQDFKAQLESMGSEDMKGLLSTVVGDSKASGRDWQILTRQMPDGSNQYVRVNKTNGEEYPITGAKGYAPQKIKDVVTGDHAFVLPGAPAAAPIKINSLEEELLAEGETPNDYKRQKDLEQHRTKKEIDIHVKEEEDVQEVTAQTVAVNNAIDNVQKRHLVAWGQGTAGPLGGRVSNVTRKIGFSAGEDADAVSADMGHINAAYIKMLSGATVTDNERADIESRMPKLSDSPALFASNMKSYQEYMERFVDEKRMKAGMAPVYTKLTPEREREIAAAQGPANTGGQQQPPRQPKTIKQKGVIYTLNEETGEYE